MIRKGLFFLRILLVLVFVWLWSMSYRERKAPVKNQEPLADWIWDGPWLSFDNIYYNRFLWIELGESESIEISLGIRRGVVNAEIKRREVWLDDYWDGSSSITSPATPVNMIPPPPPQFDLYYYTDTYQEEEQIDCCGISFPLWFVILLLMFLPTLLFIRGHIRRRWRSRRGLCTHCGYDLRGTPEPRCPECGTASDE